MFNSYQKLPNALENIVAEIVDGYGRWQKWKTAFIIDFEPVKMSECSFTIQKDYPGALGNAYHPKLVWSLTGYYPTHPQMLEASMVHDKLCENKKSIPKHGARISSDIFYDILVSNKAPKPKAWLMSSNVYCYQKLQKGWN